MSDVFCKACKDHDMCAHLGKCWISREALDVPSPYIAEITALRARLAEVEGALREVISVSDRKTDIYDRAKAALASAGEEAGVTERLMPVPAYGTVESLKEALCEELTARANERDEFIAVLTRCRTVLGNMAEEREGAIFNRWAINHEPLRADARGLLPIIDAVLEDKP